MSPHRKVTGTGMQNYPRTVEESESYDEASNFLRFLCMPLQLPGAMRDVGEIKYFTKA